MALEEFLRALATAVKNFDSSAPDGDRKSMCQVLLAVVQYVTEIIPERPDFAQPLQALLHALSDLDRGRVLPLLQALSIDHRPPDPVSMRLFRADAAVLMQLKFEEGNKLASAATIVCRKLHQLGYRDREQRITAKQIVAWRQAVMGAGDATDVAAERYRFVLKMLAGRFPGDPKAAFDCYLDMMADLDPAHILKNPTC